MKITKIKEDITSEIASSFKNSVAIDTEATGLQIPERDKLSLIQICDEKENVYIIQPNKINYKAPNLVSILENEKILKIGHFLRFDKNSLEYFLKCKIKNIFDTKIASKIVRTYTDSHGLKNLVFEFCNKNLDNAHSAMADTSATYEILLAQISKYDEIENNIESLSKFSNVRGECADLAGFIKFNNDGDEILSFGKYRNVTLKKIWQENPGYFSWISNADFPMFTKRIIKNFVIKMKLENKFKS